MTRQRLRPAHDATRLAGLYHEPYRAAERGDDHIERVAVTAGLAAGVARRHRLRTLADLSAGDGTVPQLTWLLAPEIHHAHLSDLVPPTGFQDRGPIEETLERCPEVDLFVCSETLEHLDDPDQVLAGIRTRARWLVCSTPLAAWGDPNPEHYWAWDEGDLHDMLTTAGWTPRTYATLQPEPGYYRFQLWACS
jgi:hypothetical protein